VKRCVKIVAEKSARKKAKGVGCSGSEEHGAGGIEKSVRRKKKSGHDQGKKGEMKKCPLRNCRPGKKGGISLHGEKRDTQRKEQQEGKETV